MEEVDTFVNWIKYFNTNNARIRRTGSPDLSLISDTTQILHLNVLDGTLERGGASVKGKNVT